MPRQMAEELPWKAEALLFWPDPTAPITPASRPTSSRIPISISSQVEVHLRLLPHLVRPQETQGSICVN
jgi:hypothetical protein